MHRIVGRIAPALLLAIVFSGAAQAQRYTVTPLVTDTGIGGTTQDTNLVNPWGVSRSSGSPFWVADNGTGKSTLYDGNGVPQSLVVTIAPVSETSGPATPTGTVFNGNPASFPVRSGKQAIFLFVTEDGTISGWNPTVDATHSVRVVNQNATGSVFKGATIGQISNADYLYVADFGTSQVTVYNAFFAKTSLGANAFRDPLLPSNEWAPFNVQNVGGNIYVTFAKKAPGAHDETDGPGLGRVDVFDTRGNLLLRLQSGAWMNAPWAVTMASQDFGGFSHDILVGQFGSGEIAAFDPVTGKFLGKLQDPSGNTISINGLWGLSFGNGKNAGPQNTLFYAAGTNDEQNGTFGKIVPVATTLIQGNDR